MLLIESLLTYHLWRERSQQNVIRTNTSRNHVTVLTQRWTVCLLIYSTAADQQCMRTLRTDTCRCRPSVDLKCDLNRTPEAVSQAEYY